MTTALSGRSLLPVIVLLGLLAAGTAIVATTGLRDRAQPLPIHGHVPSFELLDQTGAPYPSTELEGRVWIASFIYTTCPGPCPRVVERLGELQRTFAGDPRVRIVSFSVDPQADTPEVLDAYGRTHGIDYRRWVLLTGPAEVVADVVRSGFFLSVERAADARPEDGPVIHSTRLVLVDDVSRIRGYYDSNDPTAIDRLVQDTRRLTSRL